VNRSACPLGLEHESACEGHEEIKKPFIRAFAAQQELMSAEDRILIQSHMASP
jgi:hypothetical protein